MATVPVPSKKMYGVTHDLSGAPVVIEPKALKVGIGLAKGPAIHVYIDLARKWVVQVGVGEAVTRQRFDTKLEAKKAYRQAREKAPERKYPQRLPHFTFSHISPDGSFEPDWEVIELHGPVPTEIDIVFVTDEPFSASYQMWTAAEKKCDGDGITALRVLSMAATDAERYLAEQARKRGERYFPIVNQCWTKGCQYSKGDANGRPSPCRPRGRLLFQLVNSPRLGGTAYWDTTGFRSISQVFSSIETFKRVTGQGDPARGFVAGIPMKMVLRPYKTTHDGKSTTQYGVSLEFRAESAVELKRRLIEQGVQFRLAAARPLKALESAPLPVPVEVSEPDDIPAAIEAEFDPSPVQNGPAAEPAPADEDYVDGPIGDLGQAWDDDALGRQEPTVGPSPAAEVPSPAPQAAPLASVMARNKLWELCRSRGMSDATLKQKLGSEGFETLDEVTSAAIPGLMTWASQYKPGQGSLV